MLHLARRAFILHTSASLRGTCRPPSDVATTSPLLNKPSKRKNSKARAKTAKPHTPRPQAHTRSPSLQLRMETVSSPVRSDVQQPQFAADAPQPTPAATAAPAVSARMTKESKAVPPRLSTGNPQRVLDAMCRTTSSSRSLRPSEEDYRALLQDLLLYRQESLAPIVAAFRGERELLEKRLSQLDAKTQELHAVRRDLAQMLEEGQQSMKAMQVALVAAAAAEISQERGVVHAAAAATCESDAEDNTATPTVVPDASTVEEYTL